MSFVLSLDVGTSSVRASLYDASARAVPGMSSGQSHVPDTTPDGGVEMDAEALFQRSLHCVEQVLAQSGARAADLAGVGLCTFWHSILGVGADGLACTPILLWADTRSTAEVDFLKEHLDRQAVHQRTGCVQHTSYVPPKLLWIARHRPEWLRKAVRWMSPGEYFHWRLFGEAACSISMASGTGMYHDAEGCWDAGVLETLPVGEAQLGQIVDTPTPFRGLRAEFRGRLGGLDRAAWFPAAGDGACSNVGSGCTGPERVAVMVGTSGAMRVLRSGEPLPVPAGLWRYRWDCRRYLLGGALSNGGNLFSWLTETLRVPEGEALETVLAEAAPDAHGLTVLPFLAGERCPGWRGDARAAIVGLSWHTSPMDILRAGLEAVAYRFALIHERLDAAAAPEHQIVASGGALLASPAWTQLLADVLGRSVAASEESEASSRGAALLALQGLGLIPEPAALPGRTGRVFVPNPEHHERYRTGRARQAQLYETLLP